MSSQCRLAAVGNLVLAALTIAACAPAIHVNSYVERGADLGHYRTYDFAPLERVATGDPRLDANPMFTGRVQTTLEAQLAAKGYTRAVGKSDFRIHFHASVTQQIDVNDLDRQSGYCEAGACKPFVYDAGTLLLDFVDTGTNRLIWRGWAESSLDGVVDNQAWMNQRIDEAVTKIVARLPHRS